MESGDTKTETAPSVPASVPVSVPASEAGDNLQENDFEVEVKLADLQESADSPLYSVTSFHDLGLLVTSPTLRSRARIA